MSWTPDESPTQLITETAWLQGYVFAGVTYGVVLLLFAMCSYTLWERVRIKGGPSAYANQMYSVPVNIASCVACALASWSAVLLMLWRCMVIYQDCGTSTKTIAMGLSSLVFLGVVVLSILWLVQVSSPSSSLGRNTDAGFSYTGPLFGAVLAANIILTIMIAIRLLYHRRRVVKALGNGGASFLSLYTSITAIVVESASLYSVSALLFVANGDASLLIIYRVSQGKAWSQEADAEISIIDDKSSRDVPMRTLRRAASDLSDMRFNPGPIEVQARVQPN
ncbi:hypothetical protein BV22DRAFT_1134214 [Leucogyrophana mollusca]|uniref:Uncharacterized protein n=1 Tax=Leucogyrophana mollusca TaxID=85980 RepID=A0ACB8B148_9AGAM|nr:hypothetical protein BV22DRAFT_1134214 [Leucogyrophana mollusca]